jgi:proline dehydrogenase
MKATFFSHFAGGEDGNEIKPLVEQLRKGGITGMVIYNAEDDISGNQTSSSKKILDTSSGIRYYHESEKKCDIFLKNTIDCIDTAAGCYIISNLFLNDILKFILIEVSGDRAITAIKITAFMQPSVLQKLSNLTLELKKQKEDSKSDSIFNFLDGDYE